MGLNRQQVLVARQAGKSQMASDLLESWKENKFIVAPQIEGNKGKHIIVLTDIGYWAENYDALIDWCKEYDCRSQGMTIVIPDEETLALFVLKWS